MSSAYSSSQLEEIISNAVHSALLQNGIKSKSEAVSTASSSKSDVDVLAKKACERRLKNVRIKYANKN